MAVDEAKLNEFMGRFVGDLGAVMHAARVVVGDQLGLYKALAEKPQSADALARRTETDPRYLREWLSCQAERLRAVRRGERHLQPERRAGARARGQPGVHPGRVPDRGGAVQGDPEDDPGVSNRLGLGWHEHDAALFHGTERFFRPGYAAHLVSSWIPSLDGMQARLEAGASVADVGCGHGASTLIMAEAFPRSTFAGFDYHEPSIAYARAAAQKAGVAERVRFEVASAKSYPGSDYDLVTMFDCLHDMGDPAGAAAHVRASLREDGLWMIVEPFANDRLEDNLNPVGRIFYAASTFICTPASRSQEVGFCLGAQAGAKRLRAVVGEGGFAGFRRAAETPFNLIFEARR